MYKVFHCIASSEVAKTTNGGIPVASMIAHNFFEIVITFQQRRKIVTYFFTYDSFSIYWYHQMMNANVKFS